MSFQVETAGALPQSPDTGWPWFRYVFNLVLSSPRCSARNLTLPAKCCSSSALGNTCSSTNRNVRRCTLIKDNERQSSISSRLIALAGSYLVHIFPGSKASPNITVLDVAKQLGTKYGDFLHILTLFALVSVKSSKVQGTEAQHATAMVQATTHIFQSLSKARSTSLGVLNAKALLSGPRIDGLHQNCVSM